MMTAEKIDSKVDKIVKLNALAEAASTDEERANAQDKINRLMATWSIDQAKIDARKEKGQTEALVEKSVQVRGIYHHPFGGLISSLANLGDMRILQGGTSGKKTYYLLGFESDVDQALILFESLQAQAHLALKKARKTGHVSSDYKDARDFMFGFSAAASTKIRQARAEVLAAAKAADEEIMAAASDEAQAEDAANVGAELAIATKKERVDEFLAEKYPRLGKARSGGRLQSGWGNGTSAGLAAGRQANVGTNKGIGSGPGQLR